jgi:hypothetical protein
MLRRHILSLLVFCCLLPAQTMKVIANLSPDMVKELAVSAPNVRIVPARGADLAKEIEDADAMVGVTLTPDLLKRARQLKWLHIGSAGVESRNGQSGLFPELVESNVERIRSADCRSCVRVPVGLDAQVERDHSAAASRRMAQRPGRNV